MTTAAKYASATFISVTTKELAVLKAIRDSEYQDGGDPVGHHVWTSYINPFDTKKSLPGVMASLSKKGLITRGGGPEDANYAAGCDGTTVALTARGFEFVKPAA